MHIPVIFSFTILQFCIEFTISNSEEYVGKKFELYAMTSPYKVLLNSSPMIDFSSKMWFTNLFRHNYF